MDPFDPACARDPAAVQIDVNIATDDQVVQAAASLIHAYIDSLRFSANGTNQYNGSPEDVFLQKNNLPRNPDAGESNLAYSQRLLGLINGIDQPIFVSKADAPPSAANGKPEFRLQKAKVRIRRGRVAGPQDVLHPTQRPEFAAFRELRRLPYTAELQRLPVSQQRRVAGRVRCHFRRGLLRRATDTRSRHPQRKLRPVSAAVAQPSRCDFALPLTPVAAKAGYTDLGVWNIVGNPDAPNPQATLLEILCGQFNFSGPACTDSAVLPLAIAYFKTPTLRDSASRRPFFTTDRRRRLRM